MINILSLEDTIRYVLDTKESYCEIMFDILKTSNSIDEVERQLYDGFYTFSVDLVIDKKFVFKDFIWEYVTSITTNTSLDPVFAMYRRDSTSFRYNGIIFHLDEHNFINLIYTGRGKYNEKDLYENFNGTLPLNIKRWTNEHLTYLRMMED